MVCIREGCRERAPIHIVTGAEPIHGVTPPRYRGHSFCSYAHLVEWLADDSETRLARPTNAEYLDSVRA